MNELLILRQERRLKRTDFADFLGIPIRTYEKWETGERKPPEWVISLIKFKCEKSTQGEQITFENLEKVDTTIIKPSEKSEKFNVIHTIYESEYESYTIYKDNDPFFNADVHFRELEDKKGYKYNPKWETFEVFRI